MNTNIDELNNEVQRITNNLNNEVTNLIIARIDEKGHKVYGFKVNGEDIEEIDYGIISKKINAYTKEVRRYVLTLEQKIILARFLMEEEKIYKVVCGTKLEMKFINLSDAIKFAEDSECECLIFKHTVLVMRKYINNSFEFFSK